ncbi:MAG: alpha/beta hydrolase [Candidatus Lokiarchaeota archaeon]|nr:alpha/beta hydrolase [Candidatus Lokiarchaeota archaeon]
MVESFAEVNGIKICYEIYGNGYPVVLVHGFGGTKEGWRAQTPDLSKDFKVIRFDNRGAGSSDKPKGSYELDDFVEDIKGLLDHLNIDKAHIIGWSLGGMLVQNFVLKYPERANKVVLINTNYGTPDETGPEAYKNMRIEKEKLKKEDPVKAFWSTARTGYYIKFRKQMEAEPSKKWYGLWSVEDLIEQDSRFISSEHDIELQGNVVKDHNTGDRLKDISNPVLLLTASHDRIIPKSSMEEMHERLPNSIFYVVDKAGHNSPLEKTPEVNREIITFLKE